MVLFHVSIEVDQPQHVATVLAELWEGRALPFPQAGVDAWLVFAGDDRSTLIEVYPHGFDLHEPPGSTAAARSVAAQRRYSATHMAIATPLDVEQVFAIAAREDWPCRQCLHAGCFPILELWVEGAQLVEVMTPEMQREYRRAATAENFAAAPTTRT